MKDRKAEPYSRAFAFLRLDADGAFLLLDNFFADRKAQTSSADPFGGAVVNASEFLEQLSDLVLRNAQTVILNLHDNPLRLIVQGNLNLTGSRGKLDRIAEQIGHHLNNFIPVHLNLGVVGLVLKQ
ncbi:hypothetical protein D3C80_1495310 [compost metagenome]